MVSQKLDFAALQKLLDGVEAMDEPTRAALQRARRALHQCPAGRPPMNDEAGQREISELITTSGCSFRAAALKVARARHPFASNPEAIAERYRRKAKRYST